MNERINKMIDEELIRVIECYGTHEPGSELAHNILGEIETMYKMRVQASLEEQKLKDERLKVELSNELEQSKLENAKQHDAKEQVNERKRNLVKILDIILGIGAKIGIETVIAKSNYNMFVDLTNFEKDGNMALSRSFKEFMKNGLRIFRSNN
jgi:hypothetical protein